MMRSEITGTQVEKPPQYRVIVVIPVIYSEGQYRQICDSDIFYIRFSCRCDIRVQSVSHLRSDHSQGAFHIVGKKALFRAQFSNDTVLHGEDRICDLPWGAGDKIS